MTELDIRSFFQFEPIADRIEDLETPVPIIDIGIVERNLRRWQKRCDDLPIANRPHIKTHKLASLAKYQVALGARGITVQKLGEAEVMADAGITDLLLTFNITGRSKLARLAKLAQRSSISVVADSQAIVEGLATAGQAAGRDITVLVECDTGGARNGVQSPRAAAELARTIDAQSGLAYGGLMTYARPGTRQHQEAFLAEARDLATLGGLESRIISTGGTPDMWLDDGLKIATEYRAGTYAYFDRSLAVRGTCGYEDCAVTVLASVVSCPTEKRAIVDAGSKALTSDLLGLTGYGVIHELSDAKIYDVNEEHGYVDISALTARPRVGDLVRITPNHVCPVSNLFDKVVFVDGEAVLGAVKVDARGLVQ